MCFLNKIDKSKFVETRRVKIEEKSKTDALK